MNHRGAGIINEDQPEIQYTVDIIKDTPLE